MYSFLNFLRGMVIGVAEIIPGVSGGTMAVLMNIYDESITAVSRLKNQFKKSALFLLPLGLGMGVSILLLSRVIKSLLATYPMQMNALFLGLVVGIIPLLWRKATAQKVVKINIAPLVIMLVIMLWTTWMSFSSGTIANAVITTMDTGTFIRFLSIGFLAAVCLILPGISGSMIMVIFGIYDSVITAISSFNVVMLVPVAVGVLLGIAFGSKVLAYFLRYFPQPTYFAICGLVIGSTVPLGLRAGMVPADMVTMAFAAAALLVGIGTSLLFTSDILVGGRRTIK